ncbi:MAG: ABC transporter permease [Microthrixaceae bacterium]
MKAFRAQWAAELNLALRQPEQLLVSVGVPLGILVFFSQVDVVSFKGAAAVDYLTPATMALAVMSTSMVSLGIGTGFDRTYGVLKRLGSTPLGRGRWLAAKVATVGTIEVGQVLMLGAVGLALGWRPPSTWPLGLVAMVLGTAAFAGIGLALAGSLPALANLAATNSLYLLLLLVGGMVVPMDKFPGPLSAVAHALPAASLSGLLVTNMGPEDFASGPLWLVLAAWAVVAPAIAARTFRWDP